MIKKETKSLIFVIVAVTFFFIACFDIYSVIDYGEDVQLYKEKYHEQESTIYDAISLLNNSKERINEYADMIHNLTKMCLSYQYYMWDYNISIPELDNETLFWLDIIYKAENMTKEEDTTILFLRDYYG